MTAEELLKTLSIEEKIRLLNGNGNWNTFSANNKIPVLTMSDGPHGLRCQGTGENYANINKSRPATCFPTACSSASGWNRNNMQLMAKSIAREAKKEKVQIVLGCGLNIKRNPLCGRNFEYFSEDPYLSGELAANYVKGMQEENVAACPKHFACNNQEKNRQTASSNVDKRTLHEIYLRGFEKTVQQANPKSIMTSYNLINGVYAGNNSYLIKETLRNNWGFNGITISDWGANMNSVKSIKAGLDLSMPDSHGFFSKEILENLKAGNITEKEIDECALRIIKTALDLSNNSIPQIDYEEHHKIAVELAAENIVLLKNNGALPFNDSTEEICIIGELAEFTKFQAGGSSHITVTKNENIIEELSKYKKIFYEKGYASQFYKKSKKNSLNKKYKNQAINLAKNCAEKNIPVLFFCGLTESFEGEGFDRNNLLLPPEQIELYNELIKITKNIILVNFSGSPVDLTFAKDSSAILQMYLCGQGCAKACTNIILGKTNPSGKLAETWPLKTEEKKALSNEDEFNVNYDEGVLVGYRFYETKNIPVQYEFGFGLSYTSFEYSNLIVEKKSHANNFHISLDVQNTGKISGKEIVQIYVKNPKPENSSISRSIIELRNFEKISLNPGEIKTIEFDLTPQDFSVFSTKQNEWKTVSGTYSICAANSVKNIKLTNDVIIEGEKIENLVEEDLIEQKNFYGKIELSKPGKFTPDDSLKTLSKHSIIVRAFLGICCQVLRLASKSKSSDDPAVRIGVSALSENPIRSLISTSGGAISEGGMKFLLACANHHI